MANLAKPCPHCGECGVPTGRPCRICGSTEVRTMREQCQATQAELAERLGIDVGTLSRWERGLRRPRIRHLRELRRLAAGHWSPR